MRTAALRIAHGIRWYLKAATGEAKWDDYLERCRSAGVEPASRRDFERHRAEHKESHPQARCC
ncbi:MAG: YbdD/YjiX family protein [Dermatophilaceae bacterium]